MGERLLRGARMTQKQLHHQNVHPETGHDSNKLPPGNSRHSVRAASSSKKTSPLQSLGRLPLRLCCFPKAGESR